MANRIFCESRHFLRKALSPGTYTKTLGVNCSIYRETNRRFKSNKSKDGLGSLLDPLPFPTAPRNKDDINIGAELTGALEKKELRRVLLTFFKRPMVLNLALENGLDHRIFNKAYLSFRKFCVESDNLPTDLHIVFSDIIQGSGHVDDIFPYFLRHCHEIFPHLECMEDLKKISDLTLPANWYPEARSIQRKIIFHAGPTNSGKTYHALQRFMAADSGLYCGPLKLLASEVYRKCNDAGTPCDLITGEERKYMQEDGTPSNHVSCTVEMSNVETQYDVAIIDEIQMVRDQQRGWAWTRALLGINAKEVHLCGEESCVSYVRELALSTGDEVEVRKYKRLTSLVVLDHAIEKFENVMPGDCIVCFRKSDLFHVTRKLESINKKCAVIYGSLPPTTKNAETEKFNNGSNDCEVLVATDAVGMGLNLSIKRMIFYSLRKPMLNETGELEMDIISTPQALQIAGRAGRYNTVYENGEVTTFHAKDLSILAKILEEPIESINQGGLHPTADQIELFAYHLPKASLSNLVEIFETICELDSENYFMCKMNDFKFLADVIEHVPLSLRARYVFCCAPISVKQPFNCTMFLTFARRFSKNEPLTLDWLCRQIGWPLKPAKNLVDLVHLECVFNVLDLYLWLSYRFPDMFVDVERVRELQGELDQIIQIAVSSIVNLVKSQEADIYSDMDTENDFMLKTRYTNTKGATKKRVNLEDNNIKFNKPVTEQLLKSGIISKDVLESLKEELKKQLKAEEEEDNNIDS